MIREPADGGVQVEDVGGSLLAEAVPGATDLGFLDGRQEGNSPPALLLDAQSEVVIKRHMGIP